MTDVRSPVSGDRRAREILLLNEEIPAKKAEDWGLVNWAVPRAELDLKVDEIVAKLAAKLPEKTRYTKQQLNFWRDPLVRKARRACLMIQQVADGLGSRSRGECGVAWAS